MERIGRLCLRHPLPAVVFSDTEPRCNVFEVADTYAALGFHLPMFLSRTSTSQIKNDQFASTGIFYIPVPSKCRGDLWNMAIQNSVRFVNGADFVVDTEEHIFQLNINVKW